MNMSVIEVEVLVKQRQRELFETVRQIRAAGMYRKKPLGFERRICCVCNAIGDLLIQAGTRLKSTRSQQAI
jgi:hypothetical protein